MSGGGSSSSSSPTKPRHQHLPPPPKTPTLLTPHHVGPPPKPQYTPPLLLTVRFSTSIPDLLLDIPHPGQTTVAALKHLIRTRLEQPTSQRRLRFIHGGKILPDTAVLGTVLKAIPPPPPPAAASRDEHDPKGKGKAKAKGKAVEGGAQRVYVNCSIGDLLTDAELDEERRRAEEPVPEQPPPTGGLSSPYPAHRSPLPGGGGGAGPGAAGQEQRAPRGFDRLLSAGFTAAEVNQLRLQFRSIQEARHTADTLPSPDTLRGMEDAWIDNNNNDAGGPGAPAAMPAGDEGEAVAAAGGGEEFGVAGVLDILLKGMFIGFVWPLGAVGWLVRDEEKIPKRMRVFVYFGFVLSLLIGTIRAIG
ncbi:putative conserved membrane [Diaporthe ampelina]|uniref:Putative conserved membrane n=1 Tax=Diaporthe ampelina TaxID=1214573 RepID=A0A0G2HBP9_9PEZI|nr:putative conserved membrane [Diaporthe ampelina]